MKITYFIPHLQLSGGMERVLAIKANYMADVLGYDITIITYSQFGAPIFFDFSPKIRFIHLDIPDPSYRLHQYGFWERRKQYRNFIKTYRKAIEEYLFAQPQDVAISMGQGAEHRFLPLIKDKSKKIFEFHFRFDISPFRILDEKWTLRNLKSKYYIYQLKNIFLKYDKIITLTTSDEKDWNRYFPNTQTIANPITIIPKERTEQENCVLAVGRFMKQKGFDYLISAWSLVAEKFPNWHLDIYGHGELEEDFRQQIKKLNLENCITLYPPSKEINKVFAQHSIFALSSRFEGFGLVLLEAMASGCACVSTNCKHGPADMITNGENGFLVNVGDVSALAEKIITLIEDEKLRQKFSENAKKSAQQHFSLEQIMNKWVHLFNELKS